MNPRGQSLRRWLAAIAALVWAGSVAGLGQAATEPGLAAILRCQPGAACAHPFKVRVVIVTMFEIGADSGDAPGEFQLWKERRHLDTRVAFPQGMHDLWLNPRTHELGMVTGMGSIRSASSVLALGLDPRFDLSHAYWLVAGIAGIDPRAASIGSVAWAHWLVDGDLAHEIDAREIPAEWRNGYFALETKGPTDPVTRDPAVNGEAFELNSRLQHWAYALTRDIALPDNAGLAASRGRYVGYPQAQRAPFVLEGDNLAAMTFWHGKLMNDWAGDWVRLWTHGQGVFVTSAMEETGTFHAITRLAQIHRADRDRVLVLRGGSNYTMPPPGVSAADNLKAENAGYSGLGAALENLYAVGSRVIDALEADWAHAAKAPPR